MRHRSDKRSPAEEPADRFRREIARQEDIIYGVALFFECLSILHADEEAVVETYRKQLRNVIQKGNQRAQQATRLLADAQQDAGKTELLAQFSFSPCEGHPDPEAMTVRAELLVDAYRRVFPNRPRSQGFEASEVLLLIDEASSALPSPAGNSG